VNDLYVPIMISALGALLLWAPHHAAHHEDERPPTPWLLLLLVATVFSASAVVAYTLATATALVHWRGARNVGRTAAALFATSAGATAVATIAFAVDAPVVAFWASVVAIGLRAGVMPLHAGVAELCERRPALQAQQLATLVGVVVAHLRFADHIPQAYDAATALVRYGAVMTLVPALMALVQRDLRGFYRNAAVMHGGMIFAALGAAGHGHHAAALMVMLTTAAAVGGLGLMVDALEARVGEISFGGPGGRIHAFPKLAAAFLLFGGAGVAVPATAGFIADDLMLHALWEESVFGTVVMILGSALLAVATLTAYSRVFLGRAVPSLAGDLLARERRVVVALVLLLVVLGIVPGVLLSPAESFLRAIADATAAP
jgi:NADH:ubiquinone oxidoreductase subunit 4 (subunit M)